MAKINRFECDLCGLPMANGTEHHIQIRYPYRKEDMDKQVIYRTQRRTRTIELCESCFEERLKEFGLPEVER